MKTKIVLFGLVVAACLLVAAPVLAQKSYRAERFDVDLDVQADGSLAVKETIVFRFEGGPFTGVFRDLALVETDGIEDIRAALDGQPLVPGTGPGQVEIQDGDPTRVVWHFDPASDSAHRFELSYRVLGVVRQLDADTLIWRAIPEEHDYAIDASAITLRYPASAALLGTPELSQKAKSEIAPSRVVFSAGSIPPNSSAIVTARWQAGTLVAQPPRWQAAQQASSRRTAAALPWGLGAAALALVAGLAWLGRYLSRLRRPAVGRADRSLRPVEPPADVPPAIVARLTGHGQPSLAALFDLAERGVLNIQETKSRWRGKQYTLYRLPSDEPQRPHERALLDTLFTTKKGSRDSLPMSEVGTCLGSKPKPFNEAIEQEMIGAGWLEPQRKHARTQLLAVGVLLTVLSLLVFVAGAVLGGALAGRGDQALVLPAVLMGACAGLFVAGIAALIAGASLSVLTPAGEWQATAWKGFGTYLKDVTRGREPAAGVDVFERYLPLAAGLGLAAAWAGFFKKREGLVVPAWFQGLEGSDGDISGVIAAITAADASVSSGGDAGGAGASGGGASGAF